MKHIFRMIAAVLLCGALAWPQAYKQQPKAPNGETDQPLALFNTETASGLNAAVTTSIAAVAGQSVSLYTVRARCSAGTANVTIKNGVAGTAITSSGAAEVGTNTFTFQWPVGLRSSVGNGMDIVLSACGASNTGTLDVQASQF